MAVIPISLETLRSPIFHIDNNPNRTHRALCPCKCGAENAVIVERKVAVSGTKHTGQRASFVSSTGGCVRLSARSVAMGMDGKKAPDWLVVARLQVPDNCGVLAALNTGHTHFSGKDGSRINPSRVLPTSTTTFPEAQIAQNTGRPLCFADAPSEHRGARRISHFPPISRTFLRRETICCSITSGLPSTVFTARRKGSRSAAPSSARSAEFQRPGGKCSLDK